MKCKDLNNSRYLDDTMNGVSSHDYCKNFPISDTVLFKANREEQEQKPSLSEEMDRISEHLEPMECPFSLKKMGS